MRTLASVLRRALLGLLKGGLVGAVVAAALVHGLGLPIFGGLWLAIPAAILAGALVGVLVGRPIWHPGARIEAGLKAVTGGLLAVGLLLLVRRFLPFELAAPSVLGVGLLGDLPMVSLPLLSAVLGALFEVDHTGEGAAEPTRRRVAEGSARVRAEEDAIRGSTAEDLEEPLDEDAAPSRHQRH